MRQVRCPHHLWPRQQPTAISAGHRWPQPRPGQVPSSALGTRLFSGQCPQKVLVASPVRSWQPPARPVPPSQGCKSKRPSKRVRLSRASLAPRFRAATAMAGIAAVLSLTSLLPTAAFPCGAPRLQHPHNATASKVGETQAAGGAAPLLLQVCGCSNKPDCPLGKRETLPFPPAHLPRHHLQQTGNACFPKHLRLPSFLVVFQQVPKVTLKQGGLAGYFLVQFPQGSTGLSWPCCTAQEQGSQHWHRFPIPTFSYFFSPPYICTGFIFLLPVWCKREN